MSRETDFSTIDGVARIVWQVSTVTALCIKAGTVSAWEQAKPSDGNATKTRQIDAVFDFFKKEPKENSESQLSDFYYDVRLADGEPVVRYKIPATSVRGALRNYTIKRLISKEFWDAELKATSDTDLAENEQAAEDKQEEQEAKQNNENFKEALKTPGWKLVQNLFGIAADTDDPELEKESVAGRLCVRVGNLEKLTPEQFKENLIHGNFKQGGFNPGSTHGKMAVTTRNPLDRVTKAAKKGGLHSFMELAPGNRFTVVLDIANPKPADIGFAAFWEQAVNTGLLRFGGLTSSGRGRLNILKEGSEIVLFAHSAGGFFGFEKQGDSYPEDVLAGLLHEYRMTDWELHKGDYLKELKKEYDTGGSRNSKASD